MPHNQQLRRYGGRRRSIDGQDVIELRDPNDNAQRRFQYRRSADGIDRRVLTRDDQPMRDGSPWEPVDLPALRAVRGTYHPILDPLGF
jgi:hypothetical protein